MPKIAQKTKKIVIKKIGLLSLVKIIALLYAILGFVIGLFAVLLISFMPLQLDFMSILMIYPLLLLIMPLVYAAIGVVIGILLADIYNFISRWFGGIELDIE